MSKKDTIKPFDSQLYDNVVALLENARKKVILSVNSTMTLTYFEIGRLIVEHEQQGMERAEYGKAVLKELSQKLTQKIGKGFSVENLDRMRFFYKTYAFQNSSTPLTNSKKMTEKKAKIIHQTKTG